MAFRAVSATGVQGEACQRSCERGEEGMQLLPGGGRGWGSKKDFIEGGNLAFSFWLRIRGQARTSWDGLGEAGSSSVWLGL